MLRSLNNSSFNVVNIIIAITVIAYLIQETIPQGGLLMGLNIYFAAYDFWWQPLTTMFAHGSLMHLAMNMFVLYQFGGLILRSRGTVEFLLLYFICGLLTSLGSFAYIYFLDTQVNLVGASGAICALLGYVAYWDKSQRSGIITWVLLISVAPLLIGLPIAWYAHFIGLAIGFIYALTRR